MLNNINDIQNEIISDFSLLEDPFDQYAYLLKLSSFLPVMSEEEREKTDEVKGCQSHVWLRTYTENGLFYMDAESDTMLIRGFLYLIRKVLSGQDVKDVSECELYFLSDSGLANNLNADRRKGIWYVVKEIKERAKALSLSCQSDNLT